MVSRHEQFFSLFGWFAECLVLNLVLLVHCAPSVATSNVVRQNAAKARLKVRSEVDNIAGALQRTQTPSFAFFCVRSFSTGQG